MCAVLRYVAAFVLLSFVFVLLYWVASVWVDGVLRVLRCVVLC